MDKIISYTIKENDAGIKLGTIIRNRLGVSNKLLKSLKADASGITINGKQVYVNALAEKGDTLILTVKDIKPSENIIPINGPVDIVFENEDYFVINKQAGVPCHPSKGHTDDSIANFLAYRLKDSDPNFVFRCLTRLDKDTSGLIVVSKNRYSHELLTEQILNKTIKKTYYAIATGLFEKKKGIIDANIRRVPGIATIEREVCGSDDGETAVTEYEVEGETDGYSFLKIKTKTGRTHQIRVHMRHIGHPLAGDWLYGEKNEKFGRQMLHCGEISLTDTVSGNKMIFKADIPSDFGVSAFNTGETNDI